MKFGRKRGVVEFVPLAIGLAIAIIVIVSVTIPIVNSTTYNATSVWGGTTGTILSQLLPLVAVMAIAVVAVALYAMFR